MNDGQRWLEYMRRGEFEAAWRLSDRARGEHLYDGRPLHGKRVVLLCDRGLGDAIQFVRFVPMLNEIAREVILWSRPDAVPLLARARGVTRVVPWSERIEGDVFLDIMQLGHVFRVTVDTIPNEVPYLHVIPSVSGGPGGVGGSGHERRLPARPGPSLTLGMTIGVGIRTSLWDAQRDVPESLSERLGGDVVLLDQPHGPKTPLETARVVKGLDLVISADTFFAHLAGALAVPVWTLLHADCDWRWMLEREDSPWYPTMRLFRQPRAGDWDSVISRIEAELCYLPRIVSKRS